jgi:hypothetical protein
LKNCSPSKVKDDLELVLFTGISPDYQQDVIFNEEAGSKGQGRRGNNSSLFSLLPYLSFKKRILMAYVVQNCSLKYYGGSNLQSVVAAFVVTFLFMCL